MRVRRAVFLLLALMVAGFAVFQRLSPPQPVPTTPLSGPIEQIVIEKAARRMTLYQDGQAVRVYKVALGSTPQGDKTREGDGKTPEGRFTINRRNPNSAYHLSLGIDYPQKDDIARARSAGVSPGGDIFIHGQPPGMPNARAISYDWTAGCIAVSNAQMDEIWAATPTGTPVEILP